MLSFKTDVNVPVPTVRNKHKKMKKLIFLLESGKPLPKRAGSGSVIQYTDPRIRIRNPVYGSKDPYQHVTDPEHWKGPMNNFGHVCPYEARDYISIGFSFQRLYTYLK
jgi:hypothetical protein